MRVQRKGKKVTATSITIAALLLAPVLLLSASYLQSWWPFEQAEQKDTVPTIRDVNSVDYSGPTEEDIEYSQEGKKNSSENANTESEQQSVAVGVSFAKAVGDNVEVRAFTPSVIEGDGTCTAKFTNEGSSITQSSKAFIDSTSSQCQPIIVPVSKFDKSGSWSLVLSYKSPASTGSSEPIEVTIP